MSDKVFVDTNILIYAYDRASAEKRKNAAEAVKVLWNQGNGVLSTQVLQEFYVNVTRKIGHPVSPDRARSIIATYLAWRVEVIRPDHVLQASEIQERHKISFWDAMIVVSAMQSGAAKILTEDLNHGQLIEGVLVENPFMHQIIPDQRR
ncbi:MAG: PIN domain-containing protein [Candidatus Thiodiazotropha sp. (ex Dulcina madagascariensis)]|nr:PIN domain-containing protein [Candidatus Thiodiazotropha sp. (ex Dulcina madagascariensis)]